MVLRSFLIGFLTCVTATATVLGTASGKSNQSTENVQLRLNLTVTGQKYCVATDHTDVLQVRLLLTFTNDSSRTLILSKSSNEVVRTLVSKSWEEAGLGKHELNAMATHVTSISTTPSPGATPTDAFSILAPSGTFQADACVTFEVSRTEKAPPHAIPFGFHVLQVVVSTWSQSPELASELAARWADSGRLWYTAIRSEPILFQVSSEHTTDDCSKYAGLLAAAQQDPNAVEAETGITALMAAIELNDIDLFNSLLARGAKINAAPGGMAALCLAAATESVYVKRLIQLGADVNTRSLAGQTPLTVAVRAGKIENVKLLLAGGATVNTPGPSGKTPLALANELLESKIFDQQSAARMVALLKRAGAKE